MKRAIYLTHTNVLNWVRRCSNLKHAIRTTIVFIALSSSTIGIVPAQNQGSTYTIKGTLLPDVEPFEYANIVVLNPIDSSIVRADLVYQPQFEVGPIAMPNVLVRITSFSYNEVNISATKPEAASTVDLGQVPLTSKVLNEVTVKGNAQLISREPGMTTVNVAATHLSESGTAIDVLKMSPQVLVNSSNKIEIFGKGAAKVYINGREAVSDGEVAELSSREISKIEIITNPSAKYDASAKAIVNIVTKNKFRNGYSLSHGSYFTAAEKFRYYGDLDASYKNGKTELYAFGSTNYGKTKYVDEYFRTIQSNGAETTMENRLEKIRHKQFPYVLKAGANYWLTPNSKLGYSVRYSNLGNTSETNNTNNVRANQENTLYKTFTQNDYSSQNLLMTALYTCDLDTMGQSISVKADYSTSDIESADAISESIVKTTELANQKMNTNANDISLVSVLADYVLPFGKSTKLNTGVKLTSIENNSSNLFERQTPTGWETNAGNSSTSEYTERMAAGYAELKQNFNKLSFTAGLRAELSNTNGLTSTNGAIERTYRNLFPTAQLDYDISDNLATGLSYSKRIERPSFQDLNPFVTYIDSLSYFQGNPELKPALTHSAEFYVSYMKYVSFSIGYMHTLLPVLMYVDVHNDQNNATYVMMKNFDSADKWSFTLNLPYQNKVWTSINSIGYSISSVEYNENDEQLFADSKPLFYAYSNQSFKLPHQFGVYFTYQYNSSGLNGIFAFESKHLFNMGVSKRINKQLNVQLTYTDVFKTDYVKSSTQVQSLNLLYNSWYDASYVRFSITYNLGRDLKISQLKSGLNKELNRIKMD